MTSWGPVTTTTSVVPARRSAERGSPPDPTQDLGLTRLIPQPDGVVTEARSVVLERLEPALLASVERVATLVLDAPDLLVRVPRSEWTMLDVLRHLVTVTPRYARWPEGRQVTAVGPQQLAELNAADLREPDVDDVASLCARLRDELGSVLTQIRGHGLGQPTYAFHGGGRVRADSALRIVLGEYLIHGWDMAQALGHPWPWPIEPASAWMVLEALQPILPGWVDPSRAQGLTATFEIRVRGFGRRVWAFRRGRLEVDHASVGNRDVVLSADPVAFLLVADRRESPWKHIARGRLAAWGRRPWLALSLVDRFHTP